MRIVQDRKLYANADALEGKKAFASFEEYFNERLGKPFTTWAELEQTHQFVHKYKPELLSRSWDEARRGAVAAHANATVKAYALGEGRPKGSGKDNPAHKKVSRVYGSTSAAYLTSVIARDHPAILADMKAGRYKSVRAAVDAADKKNKAESKQGARTDLLSNIQEVGPTDFVHNVNKVKRPWGNSKAATLRRLRKDFPKHSFRDLAGTC